MYQLVLSKLFKFIETFSKSNRLLTKSDFEKLKKTSKSFRSKKLIFFYSSTNSGFRLGMSISKKYGNAVKRNKLKRHLREIIRKSELMNKSISLNIAALKGSKDLEFEEVYLEISKFINNLSWEIK